MAFWGNLTKTQWQIVRDFCNGDIEAGVKMMNKYSGSIREYIVRSGYKNEADDWSQRVYLKVIDWVTDARFDPDKSHFRSLVHKCIKRTISDELTKLGRRPKEESIEDHPEAEEADRLIWNEVYFEDIQDASSEGG